MGARFVWILPLLIACGTAQPQPGQPQPAQPVQPAQHRFTGVTGPADAAAIRDFPAGTAVVCRWQGGSVEYAGVVGGHEDGRLLVNYNDGDSEQIGPSLCRKGTTPARPAPVARGIPTTGPADPTGLTPFRTGDRVACRYRGGPHDYVGTVGAVEDGHLRVDYDDGDSERITPGLCALFQRRMDARAKEPSQIAEPAAQ